MPEFQLPYDRINKSKEVTKIPEVPLKQNEENGEKEGNEGEHEHGTPIKRPPESTLNVFNEILTLLKRIASAVAPPENEMFYEVSSSITTAHGSLLEDDSGYTRERVFDQVGRMAPKVNVYNDGPGTWFVRVTHDGQNFTEEFPIYEGETKTYYNVYELRHRSATVGLNYRISEHNLTQQTAVSTAEKIEIISTDKDLHFTGAIVMNDHEKENITGLLSNKYMIRGVNIQSDQPLKYRLIFWSSDVFDNTDLDQDTYIDDVELDMTASPAFRINGANQYYLNVGDLAIIYEDIDVTRELHISLQNESAVAKLAGAAGEVQLDIKMSPRL